MDTKFLQFLRQQNIFGAPQIGNDLPSQGSSMPSNRGLSLPPPPNPMARPMGGNIPFDVGMSSVGGSSMPPPRVNIPGTMAVGQSQNPFENVSMGDTSFPPPFNPTAAPMMPPPESPGYDVNARMKEIYNPTNDATERFEALVSAYPQDKNPSWLRRIAAMVTDYTHGPTAGQAMLDEPNRKAKEDWKNQIAPAQAAATNERYENVNQRQVAYQTISNELRDKAQEAKERNDNRNAEIRQQRADVYAFKAKNPDWKVIPTKGGNVMFMNPQTQEVHDSGIPTGSLTDLDKLDMTQEDAIDKIDRTGEQARQTEGVRQTGRIALAGERGKQAQATRAVVPGGVAGKTETETNKKIREYRLAREFANRNPELGQWITPGSSNEFTIEKPQKGKYWDSGPSQEDYDKIIAAIYGSKGKELSPVGVIPSSTPQKATPPQAPPGWKYIPNPRGKGWISVPDTGGPGGF